ncbi:uncharacterized protein LOC127836591 isoform X4 [Dreissena polymorpha]|uniref:uncharacterized protein LOC127836591 isoform X4 n=1 Tax=Dreissena polymorpha TaxID=45954 RepID=UPI002264425A|nr:uncharacterized protein LOC127836591 isoform X4 [Dreissena polymorpha]
MQVLFGERGRMMEQTYGWYPSAKNVYEDRRIGTLTPYQLEALYRYRDSKYYTAPATPPEQRTPKPPRPSPSPAARPQSSHSRASVRSDNGGDHVTLAIRPRSAPIHTTYKPPPRLNLPTPQQCWSTHIPETDITMPAPQTATLVQARTFESISAPMPVPEPETQPSPAPSQTSGKIVRIQSAKARRETPTKPQRPVKSAGPVRPTPSPVVQTPEPSGFCLWPDPRADLDYPDGYNQFPDRVLFSPTRPSAPTPPASDRMVQNRTPSSTSMRSPSGKPPSGKKTPLRPKAPSPYKMELYTDADEYRSETPDYFQETMKHGWMMEIHGDPLKLKKTSKRLPYTVKVPEPETERDPPKVHMENNETFFLNTIPRRPMAFAIDKEWISEVIHKKRLEMQKKHGINYRYKNFAFVY